MNKDEKLPTSHSPLPTNNAEHYFFRASADDFKKVPGSPIVYRFSKVLINAFMECKLLKETAKPLKGFDTGGDGDTYIKPWHEISLLNFKRLNNERGIWVEANKGGRYRKWYGNREYLVLFGKCGEILFNKKGANIRNRGAYFLEGLTYSVISSSNIAFRWSSPNAIFYQHGATCIIQDEHERNWIAGLVNSVVTSSILNELCPTLSYTVDDVSKIPVINCKTTPPEIVKNLISIAKLDWDSYETSWDFTISPLLQYNHRHSTTLERTYTALHINWQEITLEMQQFEEENNRIFIEAYGLQDELMPDVPLEEITLTCNPYYRYGKKVGSGKQEVGSDGEKTFPVDPELEERLLADTMKEFMSYAVGCMFGRYSLDAPGLILANQGEGLEDYFRIINEKGVRGQGLGASENQNQSNPSPLTPNPSFTPDADNVIPILDDNWFTDDIVERFQRFLRVTFGDEHYEENLKFIEKAIGKSIRKYFLKDFYKDHVKTYKKRPIYWLFSSPKGNFNALIYMHRYRPDTVSVILNDYLREFRTKLIARKEHLEKVSISATADNREKTTALKEIEKLTKIIDELNDYETTIYDLATKNIEIDLDDGVKTNYPKFGAALKKIPGLC